MGGTLPAGTLGPRRSLCSAPTTVRHLVTRLSIVVASAGVGLALVAVLLVPAALAVSKAGTSGSTPLDLGPLDQRSYVYAADGSVLATLRAEIDRQPIPLSQIPQTVKDAVLAVEDAEFYIHHGVNLRATIRALLRNVDEGATVQGGSTITQQLVKQTLVGDARTLERKAKEAILARRLEDQMTKDQILERYLNTVYFGNGAYGVQAGAETYFGIDAAQLDLVQSAFLAGMIGNPSRFDPIRHPETSKARRDLALRRLVDTGHITQERAEALGREPLPTQLNRVLPTPESYFVEEVKQQLLHDDRLGATDTDRENAVFRGGLRIYTTLDPHAQELAEQSRNAVLAELSPDGTPAGTVPIQPSGTKADGTTFPRFATGAVVSVEPGTGAVRAMVGGQGFADEQANIVTGRGLNGVGRSGGSTFKIFVLMALLENGYVPTDTVNGTGPCEFTDIPGLEPDPYHVDNFDNSTGSVGTILEQTLRSSNCAFVRLGQIVGIDKVIAEARKLGVTTKLEKVVSMPLGTEEVFPIDMAGAIATLAADGLHAAPYLIDRVVDAEGKVVFRNRPKVERAVTAQSARLASAVLEANVRGGTGTRARIPGQHAMGKTGTANTSSDGWFVGATPYLATAVWIGSPNDNDPVKIRGTGITGGSYPAEIWGRYMRAWHEGKPERSYKAPGPTRAGKYLQLPGNVDLGGGTTTTLLPELTFPTGFTLPPDFTLPTSRPLPGPQRGPTTMPSSRFPPGFPFDDDDQPGGNR
jgi:penicillin-binding protein 1A